MITITLEIYTFGNTQGIKESVAAELERFGDIRVIKAVETEPMDGQLHLGEGDFDLYNYQQRRIKEYREQRGRNR